MNIAGTAAVITGGASGLGAASARMLVTNGGRVVLLDVNEDLGHSLVQELGTANARFVKTDVSDGAQAEAAINASVAAFGAVHIALNCAGIGDAHLIVGKEGPAELDRFIRVIRINLIGTYNVARLAAAAMTGNSPNAEGERGVIINTASIAAYDGQIGQCAYAASKGGIVGLTLPMARDLARHGIRVATIAPGTFDTPLLARLPENVKASLGAGVPFPQRLGRPVEYAHLAKAIIENVMLNGEVIRLDGALRMAPK